MLTVIYSRDAKPEAELLVAASEKKSKVKRTRQDAVLVSVEQLRDWNITASRLHATLAEVLLASQIQGFEAQDTFSYLILSDTHIAKGFYNSLHSLRTVSKACPNIGAIGYHSFPSELSKLLDMVLRNLDLIGQESISPSTDLLGTIAAISAEKLKYEMRRVEELMPVLNG